MEVFVTESRAAAAQFVVGRIAERVRLRPRLVLGLATGRTMGPVYAALVARHRAGMVSFRGVRTVNLDEYVGLGANDPGSFAREMDEHFFGQVDIDPANTYLPNGTASDADAEAARYEKLIAQLGGIDLQLLGIGRSGHIGFNEPPSPLDSPTRVVTLDPTTHVQNAAAFGGNPERVPNRAITMGVATIMRAAELLVLATGVEKAPIVAAALEGPITPLVSASAIQSHPRCTVVLDRAAGANLTQKS
jgi:glucosamine-6-phosphate deaminase